MPKKLMYTEQVKDVLNCAVSDLMAQNGFDEILRYLHLAGNSNLNENEKLAKVFDHSTICWILFVQAFQLDEQLCVDEFTLPYYGRHSAK